METTVNVIPGKGYLIIEAWNDHCSIRVAEKNNHIIFRLLKADAKLKIKTCVMLIRQKLNKKVLR